MTITCVGSDEDISVDERNSVPFPTAASENETSCFDCNICLDSAHDPVVTLCGHLYCWPCIYKWLQVESSGPGSVENSKCPVCKAHISNSSLVPLYGRGISSLESEPKKAQADVDIPHRPRAIRTMTLRNSVSPIPRLHQRLRQTSLHPPRPSTFQHHRQYFPQAFGSYAAMAPSSFGSTAMTSLFSPVVGVFGEMFSSRMFGIAYPHPRSYLIRGRSGLRMQREEMQADKSLNRLNKRPEFTAWLAEIKKVNLESLPNWEEKQLFKQFMEDHNTATFPSKKYYNLDAYYRRKMEKECRRGVKKVVDDERTVFDDEEQRRQELMREREKHKQEQVEALKCEMQSGMAQAMKEQAQLREEMAYQYKLGNFEAAAAIQRRLDPDLPM
ncbi:hypothetical protein KY289_012195 [Solanum tuberosum]|nr:hypothetical protein KY289_012195 [Solanum tuberosum]KAH0710338.1 hypothetical protein KY284_011765 [Solanum tuberosum]